MTTAAGWRVPLVEIEVTDEDLTAVEECLRSGWLTMGPRTEEFEAAFTRRIGSGHAVAASSGTAALHLSLCALGIGPGDEVIVPALSFVACAHAVRYVGATPVLCDASSPLDFNLSPADVQRRITDRTTAVIAVHLFGYPADVHALGEICDRAGIALVEDVAQAMGAQLEGGAQAGSVGRAACFSFFSKKQVPTGEGGMVVSDDASVAEKARLLRSHAMTATTWERHRGHAHSYDVVDIGFNYRLDELHAALGLSRLERLKAEVEGRREGARAYRNRLEANPSIEVPASDEALERSSPFSFPILVRDSALRDAVRTRLHERGVQTTQYPTLNRLSTYGELGGGLDVAEEIADRHLVLPLFASLSPERIDLVVDELEQAVAGAANT